MCYLDIEKIRKKRKLTQQELADMVGVALRTIQNWEGGSKIPTTKHAILREINNGNNIDKAGKTGIIVANYGDNIGSTFNSDNRKYYSDSPDVLQAQIAEKDRLLEEKEQRIKEKDAQIKEKDAQIKEKDAQIKEKDAQISKLLSIIAK